MNYFQSSHFHKNYSLMSSNAFRACSINYQAPLKVASIPCLPLTIQAPDQMSPPLERPFLTSLPEVPPSRLTHTQNSPPSPSLSWHLVCITSHTRLVTRHGRQEFCLIGHCLPRYLKQHQEHSTGSVIIYWMDECQFLEISPSHLELSPEKNLYNWSQTHFKEWWEQIFFCKKQIHLLIQQARDKFILLVHFNFTFGLRPSMVVHIIPK